MTLLVGNTSLQAEYDSAKKIYIADIVSNCYTGLQKSKIMKVFQKITNFHSKHENFPLECFAIYSIYNS